MKIRKVDVYASYNAEAVYMFCRDEEVYDDFCEKSVFEDLSLAEYVQKYRYKEFCLWYHLKFEDN